MVVQFPDDHVDCATQETTTYDELGLIAMESWEQPQSWLTSLCLHSQFGTNLFPQYWQSDSRALVTHLSYCQASLPQ